MPALLLGKGRLVRGHAHIHPALAQHPVVEVRLLLQAQGVSDGTEVGFGQAIAYDTVTAQAGLLVWSLACLLRCDITPGEWVPQSGIGSRDFSLISLLGHGGSSQDREKKGRQHHSSEYPEFHSSSSPRASVCSATYQMETSGMNLAARA